MFDFTRQVTYTGVVDHFDWENPHIYLYLVADRSGLEVTLKGETGSPLAMQKRGWSAGMLKPGDRVTVKGNPPKDASNIFWIDSITTADGKVFEAGKYPDNN